MITLEMLLGDPIALRDAVQSVDLSKVSFLMMNEEYRGYLEADAGLEHYKLISAVASFFEDKTVCDIGTHYGNSSIALSANPKVNVVSYDIREMKRILHEPTNVTYRLGDFRDKEDVLDSPFIFVDVDPHDGIQEREFDNWFRDHSYHGIVMWDDIHLNPQMEQWWNELTEDTVKFDLTPAGHWSGTGMIFYR